MGSSGGGGSSKPSGTAPPPPANKIIPQGGTAPLQHQWINFLGDTNVPSRGLTPEMLSSIMATQNVPPPIAPQASNPMAPAAAPRDQLAQAMSAGPGGGRLGGRGAASNGNGWGGH